MSMMPATRVAPGASSPFGPPPEPPPPPPAGPRRLILYYRQERHEVSERFVIGRGSKGVDLTVRDPNVSRQHVMVEKLNDRYFIVDMGSTNGIEFNGNRVQRKELGDGDLINLCGHELRFVYE
jgi:pSer/pThr/pTyr-binding forkhead associated (FHA) protein